MAAIAHQYHCELDFTTYLWFSEVMRPAERATEHAATYAAPHAAGRVLHLIDHENLQGSADFTVAEAAHVHSAYTLVAPYGSVNQIVLATSHHSAPAAWFAWPLSARRLVRSGQDGADLELLDVLAVEDVAMRFDHVVIGSGDGIFTLAAARLQSAGCAVTVICRRRGLSRQLGLAVRDVRFIDALPAIPLSAIPLGRAA